MFWFVPGGPHKINTFLSNILKGNSRQPVEGGEQSPAAAAAFVFSEAVVGQSEEQFSRSRIKQVSPAQPRWRPGPRQAPSLYLTCSSLGARGGWECRLHAVLSSALPRGAGLLISPDRMYLQRK